MKKRLHSAKLVILTGIMFLGQLTLSAQPVITAFSPQQGEVGSSVTITGSNFSTMPANNIVYFGAAQAVVTAASATMLTVRVPAGATYDFISVNTGGLAAYAGRPFDVLISGAGDHSSFAPYNNYTASSYALVTAVGDLNGDGKPDVAVTNYQAENTVSVYVNETTASGGTVTLAGRQSFATGASPAGIAIGDIDGDGKLDIVTVNGDETVSVLRNTSSGGALSFAGKSDFSVGSQPFGVAISDLDGDGRPDLVIDNQNDNTISVLKNTGSVGNIAFATQITYNTGGVPYDVAVGDLDGDGKPDIVVPDNSDNTVSVFRNTSAGGVFSFDVPVVLPAGNFPATVKIADIDGDGKLDIIVANGGGNTFSVFRNISPGIGNIFFASGLDFAAASFPSNAIVTDINGDGMPDVVSSDNNSPGGAVVNLNNSAGTGNISFSAPVEYATDDFPSWVSAGDLNADGLPDLVTANAESSISVLQNNLTVSLPVILINFTGRYQAPGMAKLQWQTAVENNAAYFEIERSTDAVNFIAVGKVGAVGNSATLNNYSYTDDLDTVGSPAVFYRIRETDKDGAYTYSRNIVKIGLPGSAGLFTLVPNPAGSFVRITGSMGIKYVKITDVTGRLLIGRQSASADDFVINIGTLASGLYFVQVTDINGKIQTLKLLKR